MALPDVDTLLSEIRSRVARNRHAGLYPPGLEQELESEFRAIVDRERRDWYGKGRLLDHQLEELANSIARLDGVIGTQSRIPGGSVFHRVVKWVVGRQINGLASQTREVAVHTIALLSTVVELQKSQEDADRRLVAHLAKITIDRLAVVDHLAILITELEKRFDAELPL